MRSALVLGATALAGLLFIDALAACGGGHTTTVIVQLEGGPAPREAGVVTTLPDGGVNCLTTEDTVTCQECCRDQNTAAANKYVGYALACFCQAGTTFCATSCATTYCAKTPSQQAPGSPCDMCLDTENMPCAEQVNPQCANDPACAPVLQCLADADCQDKPTL